MSNLLPPDSTTPIRLLVADDHEVVRQGLVMVLSLEPDIVICGEARNGAEAIALARATQPTLCLLDYKMPGLNGVEAVRAIRQFLPDCKFLILTGLDADELIFEALAIGIDGYVLKQVPPAELIRAIQLVNAGEGYLEPSVTRKVMQRLAQPREIPQQHNPNPIETLESPLNLPASVAEQRQLLSEREQLVLSELAQGHTNLEIAEKLIISEQTVRSHLKNIFRKLGVNNRAGAVAEALKQQLIKLD